MVTLQAIDVLHQYCNGLVTTPLKYWCRSGYIRLNVIILNYVYLILYTDIFKASSDQQHFRLNDNYSGSHTSDNADNHNLDASKTKPTNDAILFHNGNYESLYICIFGCAYKTCFCKLSHAQNVNYVYALYVGYAATSDTYIHMYMQRKQLTYVPYSANF